MILILMIAIFSGCVDNGKTVYFSKNLNSTITLYDDNTMTDSDSNGTVAAVYRIDGDYVVMTFPPFGTVVKLKKSGNTLINEKYNETWVRI